MIQTQQIKMIDLTQIVCPLQKQTLENLIIVFLMVNSLMGFMMYWVIFCCHPAADQLFLLPQNIHVDKLSQRNRGMCRWRQGWKHECERKRKVRKKQTYKMTRWPCLFLRNNRINEVSFQTSHQLTLLQSWCLKLKGNSMLHVCYF